MITISNSRICLGVLSQQFPHSEQKKVRAKELVVDDLSLFFSMRIEGYWLTEQEMWHQERDNITT